MAGRGGYQAPNKPAAVSGPGKLSARTDGDPGKQPIRQMTDLPYGDAQAYTQQQQSAPLPAGQGTSSTPPNIIGLNEPSQRPDEPVTHGAPSGPGAGPEVLSFNQQAPAASYGSLQEILSQYATSDPSGSMSSLLQEAQRRGIM